MVSDESEEVLSLPCQELYAKGKKYIEVVGPLLEQEASEVHMNFWQ